MSKDGIEIRDVHQSFASGFFLRPQLILKGITLDVPAEGIFGLLGANGAGKTTLIHLISGLRKPTSGSVKIFGIPAIQPQSRKKLGYLPERPYFYEHLSAEQFLILQGQLSGMPRQRIVSRIPKLLELVRLADARHKELRTFSKGMLQRVGIAQAILHDPEIVILDEPMSGLDPNGRYEMRQLISELGRSGKAVFFSSHILQDMEAVCDTVALLHQGHLVAQGKLKDLLSKGQGTVEIGFRSLPMTHWNKSTLLRTLGEPQRHADGFTIDVKSSTASVEECLQEMMRLGATIQSVSSRRKSLEAFVQELTT